MLCIRKAEASEVVGQEKQANRGVKQNVNNRIHSGDERGK